MTESSFARKVDVVCARDAGFRQSDGIEDERNEQTIHHESRSVAGVHDNSLELDAKVRHRLDGLNRALWSVDKL